MEILKSNLTLRLFKIALYFSKFRELNCKKNTDASTSEREGENIVTVEEDHSIEVSPELRISSDKLESLLGCFEQDKHYPSLSSSPGNPSKTSPNLHNTPPENPL